MIRYKVFISILILLLICTSSIFAIEERVYFDKSSLSVESGNRLEFEYSLYITNYTLSDQTMNMREAFILTDRKNKRIVHFGVIFNTGEKKSFKIALMNGNHTLYWYPNMLGEIESVDLSYNTEDFKNNIFKYSLKAKENPNEKILGYSVITANLDNILNWKSYKNEIHHEDFMMFRWQSYPDVLIFSFKSRKIQSNYLKRIAFFTEKSRTRGTVQSLENISNRKGWGAHDYKSSDFVDFYNKLEEQNLVAQSLDEKDSEVVVLNEQEILLQDILLKDNIIINKGLASGDRIFNTSPSKQNASIISFARSDSLGLQRTLLFHELLHTFYFRDKDVRQLIANVWDKLNPKSQEIWRAFMKNNGYDSDYDYLIKNELFAYLLQRPIADLSWYVPSRIILESKLETSNAESKLFTTEMETYARELSTIFFQKYRLYDGKIEYVTRDR